jgi:integrase
MEGRDVDVDRYTPDLPDDDWQRVESFVKNVVYDALPHVPYSPAAVTNAVARHVDWCVNVAGLPVERGALLRRDVIAYAVDLMPTSSPSTRGRQRALLLRVGEHLGTVESLPPLSTLSAASPSQPYTAEEVDELCAWAEYQSTSSRRASARALISLGLGAGLPTRDLCSIRARDVEGSGSRVHVSGARPRTVPVGPAWAPVLAQAAREVADPSATLFRPGTRWHANIVTVFVDRSSGISVHPTTQRMRATWIVEQLTVGTPMHQLLRAAGLKSMDALVRYEKFLPRV